MIGKKILHYEIIRKLGEGGMGVVYLAGDIKLKRKVAIKFLPHNIVSNSDERKRFEIEAQSAAALNHPNIATIHAIEESDDDIFIVMEYIEGQELKDLITDTGYTDLADIQPDAIALQIARGLKAAHEKGIIHRDIKTSNIMINKDGQVKIMDFGLAKLSGSAQITMQQTTLGTLAYMAPEQAMGKEIDARADIWSFGVVHYEMFTGELPFKGEYSQAVMYALLNDALIPPKTINPDMPDSVARIIEKCLQKDPDQRFQSMSEVVSAMENKPAEMESYRDHQKKGTVIQKFTEISGNKKIPILIVSLILAALIIRVNLPFSDWFSRFLIPGEQHLMVLPINNINGDVDGQAFCDGLVETITSKLSQMEQYHGSLWVVPASEVRKNRIDSPGEAYKTFKANLAVSGSLQLINDIFRLTLNLIDAENLRQLNSAVLDIPREKADELQDRSVAELMQMLRLEIDGDAKSVLAGTAPAEPDVIEFYFQGRGYLQRYEDEKNLNQSISLFEQAIAKDSLYALAHAGLAEAYWRKYENTKDPGWAEKAHNRGELAFRLDDGRSAEVNITLGMIHDGRGQYDDAIQNFKLALNVSPTSSAAYRGLAKAYEAQGKMDQAEETYKTAIRYKPDYWAGYNALGTFYYRHERYDDAIGQFKQVTLLTPDNYRGYNNLGGMYYILKRWPEAGQMFERSFELKKSYSVASNLGTLYFIEGNYEAAAKMYETALEINDKDYRVWGNLASACQWIPGRENAAREFYKKAITGAELQLKVNPDNAHTTASLATYYATLDWEEKALTLLKKSLQAAPEDAYIKFLAGTTYEQLGKRDEAIRWILNAINDGYSLAEIKHQPELRQLIADKQFRLELGNRGMEVSN